MKFIKLVKADFNKKELDKIEKIVKDIVSKSNLPINIDKRTDNVNVTMKFEDLRDNYDEIINEFDDLMVEIKIKLLQEFRSKVEFNPISGDSTGMSIDTD